MSSAGPAAAAAAASADRPSVTAIVAATLSNGIGKDGGLPWRLPGEMKYFQRVTVGSSSTALSDQQPRNVVIMGRKTWESIPPRFRPLPGRQNIVVSRQGIDLSGIPHTSSSDSLPGAIASASTSGQLRSKEYADPSMQRKIFLIGGAQLYTESILSSPPIIDRILLTRVTTEVECDTFLTDFSSRTSQDGKKVWRLASHQELEEYVGFEVKEGEVEEKGFQYRFEMWVRD